METWVPCADYPLYEVSDAGRLRRTGKGKPLSPYRNGSGYLVAKLCRDGKCTSRTVHRTVLESFVGPRPEGMEARHLDGCQENCALGNLVWGTHADNMQDRKAHGTDNAGERHGASRLTASQVHEIRKRYTARHPLHGMSALAKEFGYSIGGMEDIVYGRSWEADDE